MKDVHTLKKKRKKRWLLVIIAFIMLYAAVIVYQTHKPLPAGLSMEGPIHRVTDADIEFLSDLTYKGKLQDRINQEQMIFDHIYQAIEAARQFVVIDMFLINGYYKTGQSFPPLSRMFIDKLIAQKEKYPDLDMVVITDEINTSYGSHASPELERLKGAGIRTVITNVDALRDSNPLYSAGWRIFVQWFGQSGRGWLPNSMSDKAPDMTLRSYMKLLNAKANHRKVIATEKTLIVPSGNAHDASSYNSNSGFEIKGNIIGDALESEQAVMNLSDSPMQLPTYNRIGQENGDIEVRLLTEGKILNHLRNEITEAKLGDTLWMGMFYLADREVIQLLLQAADRGVQVKLILDPNESAFGNGKIGIPNRPVASELLEKSHNRIEIRWYHTTQEQYHTKLMLVEHEGRAVIQNGSANFTTRNLADLNLETNIEVSAPLTSKLAQDVQRYFLKIWRNDGAEYTLDASSYKDKSIGVKRVLYKLQDWLDFTTF
ncbi:phospholipase D family protein [Paenibacillus sp. N3.4]|uniref:phospholipase D family protein n=1 Tax=Paenibacillus sp. N3.4 TaxID=2603222 RepID=UPI0011CA5118|nr:phospholipase D family protein [Paenibacillus sp. N3.4]TXK76793.1 phospholipase [Paenibacillus sp. N3.4]